LETAVDKTPKSGFVVDDEDGSSLPKRAMWYCGADEVHTPPRGTRSPGTLALGLMSNVTERGWRG
jgi:hypothetical protein